MDMLWIMTIACCVAKIVDILACPTDIVEWNAEREKWNCASQNLEYHCLLNEKGGDTEICMKKSFVAGNEEGCPWYFFGTNDPVRGSPFTPCPSNVPGCPPKSHPGYFIDALYFYPMCLLNTTEREKRIMAFITSQNATNVATPACDNDTRNEFPVVKSNQQKYNYECNTYLAVTIVMGIFLLLTFVVIACCCWHFDLPNIRKRRRHRNMPDERTEEESRLMPEKGEVENPTTVQDKRTEEESRLVSSPVELKVAMPETREYETRLTEESLQTPAHNGIIQRDKMDKVFDYLQGNDIAFLKGPWGCGKTTTVKDYLRKMKCKGITIEEVLFNCSNTHTFLESAKNWKRRIISSDPYISQDIQKENDNASNYEIVSTIDDILTNLARKTRVLLVFDEVSVTCRSTVIQSIKNAMKRHSDEDVIKCIVTYYEETLFEDSQFSCAENKFEIGPFTEKESENFLTAELGEKDHIMPIAVLLHHSPIALQCAAAYIKETLITDKTAFELFTSLLKTENESIKRHPSFRAFFFVTAILKCSNGTAYQILEHLQFLRTDNIPISLIRFIDVDSVCESSLVQANLFIHAVRDFSFIEISGKDEERSVDLHPGVSFVLQKISEETHRKNLLHTVLKCFSCIFSKRPGYPVTREVLLQLLPHASEALHFAFKMQWAPHEEIFLTHVCDRVVFMQHIIGLREKSRNLNIKMIKCSQYLKDVQTEFQPRNIKKDFVKDCVEKVSKKLDAMLEMKGDVLNKVALNFILHKVRTKRNMTEINKCVQQKTPYEHFQLKFANYEDFEKAERAIPRKNVGTWFLYQVHVNAALTFGLCGLDDSEEQKHRYIYKRFIYFACHLAEKLKEKLKYKHPFFCVLDSKFNGEFELNIFKDRDVLDMKKILVEFISKENSAYFADGILVLREVDLSHEITARKQLLNCTLKTAKTDEDEKSVGGMIQDFTEFLGERKDDLRDSFIAQSAKQFLVEYHIEKKDYITALSTLNDLSSFDPFAAGFTLSPLDVNDLKLKCACLRKTDKNELTKVLRKLPGLHRRTPMSQTAVLSALQALIGKHEKYANGSSSKSVATDRKGSSLTEV